MDKIGAGQEDRHVSAGSSGEYVLGWGVQGVWEDKARERNRVRKQDGPESLSFHDSSSEKVRWPQPGALKPRYPVCSGNL